MLGIASGLPAQPRHSTNKRVLHSWSIPAGLAPGSYIIRLVSGSISHERAINISP
ncbi:MAG: hypothetical protein G8D28_09800 [gamma proteobacterium symbiont of Phacoides pectinatus]